jgi:hypothetical protein
MDKYPCICIGPNTETPDPRRAAQRRLIQLPSCAKSITETALPKREKLLRENALPHSTNRTTLKLNKDPNRDTPLTLISLPNRATHRTLKLDATCPKSSTLIADPKRAVLRILRLEPRNISSMIDIDPLRRTRSPPTLNFPLSRVAARRLMVEPNEAQLTALTLSPCRTKLRTERLLPSWQ